MTTAGAHIRWGGLAKRGKGRRAWRGELFGVHEMGTRSRSALDAWPVLTPRVLCARASLRTQAKPYEGDKMSKRKHQIGTLFYNAKMRELDKGPGGVGGNGASGGVSGGGTRPGEVPPL